MIDSVVDCAWEQNDESNPIPQDRESFSNAPNRSEIPSSENIDLGAMNRPYFPTEQWLTRRLLPASGTLQPSIKKSGAAPWQSILTCCPSQFYGNYELPPEFWGKDISRSTSTTDYD